MTEYHSPCLIKTHSLEKLLNWLIKNLSCTSEELFSKEIQMIVIEFHNMDTDGQKFRYPIFKGNNKSFPCQSNYDLIKIKDQINKAADYFMGIDAWMDHYALMADSMLEDMGCAGET